MTHKSNGSCQNSDMDNNQNRQSNENYQQFNLGNPATFNATSGHVSLL